MINFNFFKSYLTRLRGLAVLILMLFAIGIGNAWGTIDANSTWTATALGSIPAGSTVIISSSNNKAISNNDATSSGPLKIAISYNSTTHKISVTTDGKSLDDVVWTTAKTTNGTQFWVYGSNTKLLGLSSTSSNNAVRVTTTGNASYNEFVMGSGNKLLKYYNATRYVGEYVSGSDFRSYNSETAANYSSSSLTFYVMDAGGGSTPSLTATPTSLDWTTVNKGASLSTKTFTISGSNLTGNLSVSATGGYSVSCGSSITVTSGSPTVTTITVTPPSTSTAGTKNGTITISGGGLASNVTVSCGLVVNEIDQFIDDVQSTTGYTSASPHVEAGSYCTTPTLSDKSVATSGTCEQQHYHFVGWVTSTKYEAGTAIVAGDLQTPTSATGATYYAVWAKQAAGGGGDVSDVIDNAATTDAVGSTGTSSWASDFTITGSNSSAVYTIHSMGINGATNYALQWNKNAYLYTSTAPTSGLKLKSITITTLASKTIALFGATSAYAAKATSTSLVSQAFGTSGTTYSLTSAQLSSNYTCVGINGTESSTQIVSITITYSGGVSYEDYIAKCCNELGSINGSVKTSTVSSTGFTLQWDDIANVSSWAVTGVDGSSTAVAAKNIGTPTDKGSTYECVITGLTAGTSYTFTITPTPASGYCPTSDDVAFTAPNITLGSASGASVYIEGEGPGSKQTFTVTAVGLTGNLTVTAPTYFEVCGTENGTYASSITLTPSSGAVSTTVYFRLVDDKTAASSPYAGNVTVSGGSASSQTVAVSGTVSPACENPTISSISSGATYRMNTTASAISVSASKNGTGPALTYQWYSNTANNTSTGSAIPSATSNNYTPPTTSAGTIYYYCVVSSGACSSTSSTVAITVSTPTITVSESSRAFSTKKIGGSYEMTFTVSASNLSGSTGITVTKSGTNVAMFSIDASSPIAQTSAGALSAKTIIVTYSPTTAGAHTATLTFSSTGAADKTVNLSGTGQYEDLYKTALHTSVGALSDYVTGVTKAGTGYSVPVLSDVSKSGSECDGLHYHFAGWVEDTYKADPTGHIVAGSGTKDASNKTFWAVWEQDGDGGNTLTKLGKSYTPATNDNIVIVAIDGSDAYALYQETYSTNYVKNWSFVNNVSNVSANAKNYVTLTSDGASGWYLGDATNGYIYTSSSNNLSVETSGNKTSFTIAWNDTEKKFTIVGNSRWLSCRTDLTGDNDNKYRLGGATSGDPSGTAYFDLYKYVGAVYEDPVAECAVVTCATPTSATNTSVTANGATIGWTGGGIGTLSKYEYVVWIDGESEPTSGYVDNGTNTSKALTGLLSNTTYRWKVRKVCSGEAGESSWLRSSFTTSKVTLTFSVPTGASSVDGQDSDEELPDAEVPTTCGDCWAFIGWTPAVYSGTTLPAKIFEEGEYAHLASGDGTTLYALYANVEYKQISSTSELVADNNYVLAFYNSSDSHEYALSNSAHISYATDAAVADVTDNKRQFAGTDYLYSVGNNNVWTFTGTSSSGQLYNSAADKYLNLSSDESCIINSTNNLSFAVSEKLWTINSTYYLGGYNSPSNGYDAVDASTLADSRILTHMYRQTSATYTTSPTCTEYDIAWKLEGETYSTGTPSTSATTCGGIETMPTAASDNSLGCATLFMGWSESELTGTGNNAPADLFTTITNAPKITTDKIFHAVFATGNESDKENTSVTTTFTSKAWADANSLWTSGQDGSSKEDRGVQVQTSATGANATTNNSYSKVTSVVITYSTSNSGAGSVAVEVGGTAMTLSSGSISPKQSNQTLTYTPTSPATSLSGNVKFTVNCTTNSIYIKSVQIYYTKYNSYVNYVTYCTNEFTTAGNWSTAENWSLGTIPTIKERAVIKKAAVVDVTTAKARSVILDQSGNNNGKLEISSGKELVVAETIRKTTDGSNYTATGENDILINSTSGAGLGALVMGSHDGTNQTTVNFYSKSHGSKNSNESVNQFVGTPFNDANVLYNWYNSWIYEFTNTSGTASWKRIKDGDEMTPFHGYCVISAENEMNPGHMYWQQGTLVASADQNLTLAYYNSENTENMFANSWMAPIKISEMNGHMANTTGTIYIFNSGSANDGDGSKTDGSAGNYSTYTPGTAGSNVIPAMQAFTVYATAAGSLSLDYNAYVYDPAVAGTTPVANKAPQRVGAAEDEMEHLKLRVACENGWGDALDIYIREDFSEGFEMYYDGPKIEGDEQAPMLYAVTDDGKMAINCVPDAEGTVVGFRRGEDAYYQFTFDYEGDEVLYLNDLKEQISTPISMDRSYTFTSAAGDMQARFIISRTPIHNTPTGVEDNSQKSKVESRKLLIDDHVFIIRNGQMYDVTGIRVRESNK